MNKRHKLTKKLILITLIFSLRLFLCLGDEGSALLEEFDTANQKGKTEEALSTFEELQKMEIKKIELQKQLMAEEYSYRQFIYAHRKSVFKWQSTSSRIIFWMVVLIVLAGLIFSAIQFLGLGKNRVPVCGEKAASPAGDTTLKISKEGVEVSSPVVGLIILVVSLVFFYIYLTFVYPVKEIDSPRVDNGTSVLVSEQDDK